MRPIMIAIPVFLFLIGIMTDNPERLAKAVLTTMSILVLWFITKE